MTMSVTSHARQGTGPSSLLASYSLYNNNSMNRKLSQSDLSFSKLKSSPSIPSSHKQSSLYRTTTAKSSDSEKTLNQSVNFESNWLPESHIQEPFKFHISLKLKSTEIKALRDSWNLITEISTNTTASDNESIRSVESSSNNFSAFNANQFTSMLFCVQFYDNLISFASEIERLIPSIKHQASAFAGVINVAMKNLDDLSRLDESLRNLGKLHSRILGIEPEYFKIMGEALMKTLTDRYATMKLDFPMLLEESWIKLYCFLANAILQGGIDPVVDYSDNYSTTSARSSANTLFLNNAATTISRTGSVIKKSPLDVSVTSLPPNGLSKASLPTLNTAPEIKLRDSSASSIMTTSTTTSASPTPTTTPHNTSAGKRLRRLKKKTTGNEDCIIM